MSDLILGETDSHSERYTRAPDVWIKKIAYDYAYGNILGSWDIPESDLKLLPMIFLSMRDLNIVQVKEMRLNKVVHVFSFLDRALVRPAQGYPIFTEHHELNQEDLDRVLVYVRQIESEK